MAPIEQPEYDPEETYHCDVCGTNIGWELAEDWEDWLGRVEAHVADCSIKHGQGVEPLSQRYMWRDIEKILREGSSGAE